MPSDDFKAYMRIILRSAARLDRLVELGALEKVIERERVLLIQHVSEFPTSSKARIANDRIDAYIRAHDAQLFPIAKALYQQTGRPTDWVDLSPLEMRVFLEAAEDQQMQDDAHMTSDEEIKH